MYLYNNIDLYRYVCRNNNYVFLNSKNNNNKNYNKINKLFLLLLILVLYI